MRTFKVAIILLSFYSCTGCKHKEKVSTTTITTTTKTTDTPVNVTVVPADTMKVKPGNVRMLVSFISIGAGTDYKTREKYDAYIEKMAKKPAFDKAAWGREGEVDYCFPLTDLSAQEVADFVLSTKEMMKDNSLVIISENVPCTHKR